MKPPEFLSSVVKWTRRWSGGGGARALFSPPLSLSLPIYNKGPKHKGRLKNVLKIPNLNNDKKNPKLRIKTRFYCLPILFLFFQLFSSFSSVFECASMRNISQLRARVSRREVTFADYSILDEIYK